MQAAEGAGHAGQGGEVAADRRLRRVACCRQVLHREFMVDSGQQAADQAQRSYVLLLLAGALSGDQTESVATGP